MSTANHLAGQLSTPNHSPPQAEIPYTDTVANSAKRVGLSDWLIRQLINEGKIEARYQGRRVLVIQKSLIAHVESLPAEREE